MAKFITKSIIFLFLFLLVVTYFSEQEGHRNDRVNADTETIVVSSADLYNNVDEKPIIMEEVIENDSFPYKIAQLIEQSGLLVYEGIITVITDLTRLI